MIVGDTYGFYQLVLRKHACRYVFNPAAYSPIHSFLINP
uniref:Uncharacterized protein n=1 Tax=Parascaris equorum TaxID=6256 RepID=A0A914RFG1_PAREQ